MSDDRKFPGAIYLTRGTAEAAFAQWWKEWLARMPNEPAMTTEWVSYWQSKADLQGKTSSDVFFDYAMKYGAVIADA